MEPPKYDKRGILSYEWYKWNTEEYRKVLLAEMNKMGYDQETWDILKKRANNNDGRKR